MTKNSNTQKFPKNLGWLVTMTGMSINLALGVLYSWSVISKRIPDDWGWSEAGKSWPYSVACLIFSLVMVPAGRMQDWIGPRIVASIGGGLVGLGMIVSSMTHSLQGYILGFGVLAGFGFAFGYAATIPAAVKWFPASKTGLIAGIVVAGFGLASVYVAPLADGLITSYGLPTTMLSLGAGFLLVIIGLAQFLNPPPLDYLPPGDPNPTTGKASSAIHYSPGEVLKTSQFYLLWFMFACGAGAGLMIISKLAKLVELQADIKLGFILVAILAIGNGSGRIGAGILSDKFGRSKTLFICFVFQAILVLLLSQAAKGTLIGSTPALVVLSALIGANYGANLSLFPSLTKDFYGMKHFGINYGLVFTAWGLGGFTLSLLAGWVYDTTHTFTFAYYCSSGLLFIAALLTFLIKKPQRNLTGA
ncbi:MAG: OFA family MFS transporter [bacterium]